MKTGRSARQRYRRVAVLVSLAVLLASVAPLTSPRGERAAAQTDSARIVNSSDGVNLRAEPSYGAEVIATLPDDSVVGLRITETDTVYDDDGVTRWWPIRTAAGDGWVAGFFLEIDGLSEPAPPAAVTAATDPASTAGGGIEAPAAVGLDVGGAYARVAEPDGVNLRAEPGQQAPALAALGLDTVVELRIDETDTVYMDDGRWWPVRIDGQDGWIIGTFLAPADQVAAPAADVAVEQSFPVDAPGKSAPTGALFTAGSYVSVLTDDGAGLNIRADAAPDAERVGAVPDADVVQVMDGPYLDPTGRGWYLITDGSVSGFVDGTWLIEAGQPADPNNPFPNLKPLTPEKFGPAAFASGFLVYPVSDFTFTQAYGCSPYWFEPWEPAIGCNFHNGVDLAAPYYTPVAAADGGIVEFAGWCDCGLGYYVKIDHGNGTKTVYGHLAEQPWVGTGEAVTQGQIIAPMGSTGNSTGPHLHFIVEINGITDDPLAYLN